MKLSDEELAVLVEYFELLAEIEASILKANQLGQD